MPAQSKMKVGVSACLLGQKVRFDGQHKKDESLMRILEPYVTWVPICPEVESGFSIPREPIRLVEEATKIRVETVRTKKDVTKQLTSYSTQKMDLIQKLDLSGYILKKGSPSCGMQRVKVYTKEGMPNSSSSGVFAKTLMERFPLLPIEEEGRLRDPRLRENFFERLFAYSGLKQLQEGALRVGELVAFHTAHKFQLLSHSQKEYRELGRLVANAKKMNKQDLSTGYSSLFMSTLEKSATARRNTNVLQHLCGHFSKELSTAERKELTTLVQDYQKGLLPLIVPITLIKHYIGKFDVKYLRGQTYLEPSPKELMLRNHA